MVLFDLICLLFVVGALLAAGVAGRFHRDSLVVASRLVLPAGVAGTFIGAMQMLQNMEDPLKILPALSIAMLTALYAAVVKLILMIGWPKEPTPTDPGVQGKLGAVLWFAVLVAAMLLGSPLVAWLDLRALLLLAVSLVLVVGLSKLTHAQDDLDALARYLPVIGLLILSASIVALLAILDDPSRLGPVMAWGLLGHLYCNVAAMLIHLVAPHRVETLPTVSQWLVFVASILGVALEMTLVFVALV